jgi:hypothetical protein
MLEMVIMASSEINITIEFGNIPKEINNGKESSSSTNVTNNSAVSEFVNKDKRPSTANPSTNADKSI